MLRLFIAVDLPAQLRQEVAALCTAVRGARWVKPHQLHITLRFMGRTPEGELPEIFRRLALVGAPAFRLTLQGTGVFPAAERKPRVLWLGLSPTPPLLMLKREIDRAFADDTPDNNQEFSPHLTLARLGGRPAESLTQFLSRHADYRGAEFEVSCFSIYKSTLHARGAAHELLSTYPLAGICRGQ